MIRKRKEIRYLMKRQDKNDSPPGSEKDTAQKERLNSLGYTAVSLFQGEGDIEWGLLELVKSHLH